MSDPTSTPDAPAPDLSVIARAICKSGKFETGQGACAVICMEALGDARRACSHAERVHGKLAEKIAAALRAERDEAQPAAGAVDLEGLRALLTDVRGHLAQAVSEGWYEETATPLHEAMVKKIDAALPAAVERAPHGDAGGGENGR